MVYVHPAISTFNVAKPSFDLLSFELFAPFCSAQSCLVTPSAKKLYSTLLFHDSI